MTSYSAKVKRELLETLEEFPKTTYEAARDIGVHYMTAKNRLNELKDDGMVVEDGDKWRLNQ